MQNLDTKEISVVVQGPIYPDITIDSLQSLRKYLPGCEIILSTYEGFDAKGLDYDILVLNKDPGATRMFVDDQTNKYNLNRQILSTQNGLNKVSRKYTLKFRSDFILKSAKFIDYLYKFNHRCKRWKITEERIVMPMGTNPYLYAFHPTDVICFGLTKDIKELWSCALPSKEFSDWFINHKLPIFADSKLCSKIGAEMYIWSEFLKKNQDKFEKINFEHTWHNSEKNIELTKLTLANNTVMLDRDQFEFETPLHQYLFNPHFKSSWIDHHLWKLYYIKYCCPYDVTYKEYYNEYNKICKKQAKKLFLRRFKMMKKRIFNLLKFRI